jgi:hypothetical protein
MDVFISWSKESSRAVAIRLNEWLPDVLPQVRTWMSEADIDAGARWHTELASSLAGSRVGIICVTRENQREPWLLFETGALGKTLQRTFVCPYLIDLEPSDLQPGPLTLFQAKRANAEGTYDVLQTINRALGTDGVPDERLRRNFKRAFPELDECLRSLPSSGEPGREGPTKIDEILEIVRGLSRRIATPAPLSGVTATERPAGVRSFSLLTRVSKIIAKAEARRGIPFDGGTRDLAGDALLALRSENLATLESLAEDQAVGMPVGEGFERLFELTTGIQLQAFPNGRPDSSPTPG